MKHYERSKKRLAPIAVVVPPARRAVRCSAMVGLLVAAATLAMSVEVLQADEPGSRLDAYFADRLWPGDGPAIQDAAMLVEGGKITAVGTRKQVPVPPHAVRHHLGTVSVIPGLVAVEADLALGSDPDLALTPEHLAIDGFDFYAPRDSLLRGGITTACLTAGQRRLIPGKTAVVKLGGDAVGPRVLQEAQAMQIILSQAAFNPPNIYEPPVGAVSVDRPLEPTRPQLARGLAQAVTGLRAIFAAAGQADDDSWLATLRNWRAAGQPFRVTARSRAEVRAALQLAQQYQLPTILVCPDPSGNLCEQLLEAPQVQGVILGPQWNTSGLSNPAVPGVDDLPLIEPWDAVQRLQNSDLRHRISIKPNSDGDLDELRFLAGQFRKGGLTDEQALALITRNAAELLGIADRVGSLAQGHDADFVVLSGAPFASGSHVLKTYVLGRRVWSAVRESDRSTRVQILAGAKVMQKDGTFRSAAIAVHGGRIQSVGPSVSVPIDADVTRWPGAFITPGFIDCSANLGIGAPLNDNVALGTKLGEQLARDDEQIRYARQGGITTVLFSSSRSPSPVVAFRLTDTPHVLADPVALQFSVEENLTQAEAALTKLLAAGKKYADEWNQYEQRMKEYEQQLAAYQQELAKIEAERKKAEEAAKQADSEKAKEAKESGKGTGKDSPKPESESGKIPPGAGDPVKPDASKESEQAKDKPETDDSKKGPDDNKPATDGTTDKPAPQEPEKPKEPRKDVNLEPYRELFAKRIPAIVNVASGQGVDLAVSLFRKNNDLKLILEGTAACYDARARIAADNEVLALIGPDLVGVFEEEPVSFAASLTVANVPTLFQSKASTGVRQFPRVLEHAIHHGLGRGDALCSLTQRPALAFSLATVGKLEAGAHADLIVFSGSPLDSASRVLAVMVDGEWVHAPGTEGE